MNVVEYFPYMLRLMIFFVFWIIVLFIPFISDLKCDNPVLDEEIDFLKYNALEKMLGEFIFTQDIFFGNLSAPVTVLEYYSFSCVHCVHFNSVVMPELEKKYVNTDKVLLILRDFPTDSTSVDASMLFRCYYSNVYCEDKSKCVNREPLRFLNSLFKSRKYWNVKNVMNIITNEAISAGMTENEVKSCMSDKVLRDSVIDSKIVAFRYLNISAIPAIFINGERYSGSSKEFISVLDTAVANSFIPLRKN